MTKPRAYVIHDGDEGWSIQFATSNVAARRRGAAELDADFAEVTCHRQPAFDAYAEDGHVPTAVQIEAGWWFECHGCGRRLERDMGDYAEDGETTYEDVVYDEHDHAYCSDDCLTYDRLYRVLNRQEELRWVRLLTEALLRHLPLAEVHRTYTYASQGRIVEASVDAHFPGSRYSGVSMSINRKHLLPVMNCSHGDLVAYRWHRYEQEVLGFTSRPAAVTVPPSMET
jgi:hypothetical protein